MQRNIEELAIELIRLPKRKRLEVVRFLLFLDNEQFTANDVDSDWRQEITNRIHAVEEGTAIGVDYDNAVKNIIQRLT